MAKATSKKGEAKVTTTSKPKTVKRDTVVMMMMDPIKVEIDPIRIEVVHPSSTQPPAEPPKKEEPAAAAEPPPPPPPPAKEKEELVDDEDRLINHVDPPPPPKPKEGPVKDVNTFDGATEEAEARAARAEAEAKARLLKEKKKEGEREKERKTESASSGTTARSRGWSDHVKNVIELILILALIAGLTYLAALFFSKIGQTHVWVGGNFYKDCTCVPIIVERESTKGATASAPGSELPKLTASEFDKTPILKKGTLSLSKYEVPIIGSRETGVCCEGSTIEVLGEDGKEFYVARCVNNCPDGIKPEERFVLRREEYERITKPTEVPVGK